MKAGAIIVDLSASSGGNCALTKAGETVQCKGVTIYGPLNLAATVPVHASQLYSRNLTALLQLLVKEGALALNLQDEILRPSCIMHQGQALHPHLEKALLAGV